MILSPFAQVGQKLLDRGYSPIPLAPNDKRPFLENWTQYCHTKPTEAEIKQWSGWRDCNVGVCLGASSGLIAVDLDNDVDGLHKKILDILPPSPCIKRGEKGLTAFYRYNGEPSKGYSLKKQRVIDILSTGRQTVLPPSIHPVTKKAYEWDSTPLFDVPLDKFYVIHEKALIAIKGLFWAGEQVKTQASKSFVDEAPDEDIAEALFCIPPDCDYETWYQIGMTIKDKLGDKGYDLWDNWSAKGAKYPGSKETRAKWLSFRGQGLTISTLFYYALDHGYQPKSSQPDFSNMVEIIKGGNLENPHKKNNLSVSVAKEETESKKSSIPVHLLNPPGLVGRICKYINDTSIYPQPILAIGAALAATGTLMGHKVQSETRLRTNMYTLGIAPSGSGKDHAPRCINALFVHALAPHLLVGEVASGAALLTALRDSNGVALLQWDEIGRVLAGLNAKNVPHHVREITTHIIRLFSQTNTTYRGTQYANHDNKMPRKDIEQPCLSIYGTTVPSRFFNALTGDDAIDGFMSRWLMFESKDYALLPLDAPSFDPPPQHLVEEFQKWIAEPTNAYPVGNLDSVMVIRPRIIPYDEEAKKMINDFSINMRKTVMDDPNSAHSAIFARAAEHAIKIALCAHEGDTISATVMDWAIQVSTYCAKYLVENVREHISDNRVEDENKKLLRIIKSFGEWMPHTKLVYKTQWLETKRRNEIITTLVETGQIEVQVVDSGKRKANQYKAV